MVPAQTLPPGLVEACGETPSWICQTVFDASENGTLARTVDFIVARPLKIVLIVSLAWIANRLVRRAVVRFARGLRHGRARQKLDRVRERTPVVLMATDTGERAPQRAETLSTVLGSVASVAIWTIAILMVLGTLGISLGPLIAGAGILGIALGFGSQALVRDFLSGLFMLIEDQYGVGDIIDAGEATGTVEAITLRSTRLRDVEGTVWHIPNGQISRVGNKSQQWARALLDVSVGYGSDIALAQDVIKEVADELWNDDEFGPLVLEEPEVWGIESLGADGIAIRLVVKTRPSAQFQVMRELRLRLKHAFDEAGIEIPFPQRTVWIRQADEVAVDA